MPSVSTPARQTAPAYTRTTNRFGAARFGPVEDSKKPSGNRNAAAGHRRPAANPGSQTQQHLAPERASETRMPDVEMGTAVMLDGVPGGEGGVLICREPRGRRR